MKKILIWVGALMALSAQAEWFVDDFERADTAFTNDAAVALGDGYVLSQLSGDKLTTAKITSGRVELSQTDGTNNASNIILYNTNVELMNTLSSESFTVEGDIQTISSANGSSLQGLAFNIQPDGSYYAARINTGNTTVLQFIRVTSAGSVVGFGNIANSATLATNAVYHLKISSLDPGTFTYELTGPDLDGGVLVGAAQDTVLELADGYAGFFVSASFGNEGYALDNLSIETTAGDAGSFVDGFTRAQSVFSTNASESIGAGYVMSQLSGERLATSRILSYGIQLSQLTDGASNAQNILLKYTGAEIQNSGSNQVSMIEGDITLSATVSSTLFYGLAFNAQPDGSFYAARMNTGNTTVLQFIRVTSAGGIAAFANISHSAALTAGKTYHLKIEAFSPGVFRYTLTGPNLDGGALMGMVQDTVLELSDGTAGFFSTAANTGIKFDSLSVKNRTVGEDAGFVDDYTRANSTFSSDASAAIGAGYVLAKTGGDMTAEARVLSYGIQLNQSGTGDVATDVVLRQSNLDIQNAASDKSFVVEGDIRTIQVVGNTFYGLAFNVQPDGSFYAARISTASANNVLQFIRVSNSGNVSGFATITNSVVLPVSSWYHLKIESDTPGVFKYRLTGPDLDGGVLTGTATDTVLQLEDGTAGFYASKCNTSIAFDNLSIGTYTTEILAGYDLWADGWGVDIGSVTNDYDGDLLNNFGEYAFGGDPTNALDRGEVPTLETLGSGFAYVYPQRSDDTTLAYTVKVTDDLAYGIWSNAMFNVTGTNMTGNAMDFVTNTVPIDDPQLFIKLEAAQN